MSKKKQSFVLLLSLILFAFVLLFFSLTSYWKQASNPGPLSKSHLFLDEHCNACHTPGHSAAPEKCRLCHDTGANVFDRQVVAFHSTIKSCKECHIEHLGRQRAPTQMSHDALTVIVQTDLSKGDPANSSEGETQREQIKERLQKFGKILAERHQQLSPDEAILNCTVCHFNQDPHQGCFGSSCIECHGTRVWDVPGYIHPPDTNQDCSQCHIGPLCHYSPMFDKRCQKMLGKNVSDVNACYVCHKVDSWEDLKGIGWFTVFPYSQGSSQLYGLLNKVLKTGAPCSSLF